MTQLYVRVQSHGCSDLQKQSGWSRRSRKTTVRFREAKSNCNDYENCKATTMVPRCVWVISMISQVAKVTAMMPWVTQAITMIAKLVKSYHDAAASHKSNCEDLASHKYDCDHSRLLKLWVQLQSFCDTQKWWWQLRELHNQPRCSCKPQKAITMILCISNCNCNLQWCRHFLISACNGTVNCKAIIEYVATSCVKRSPSNNAMSGT